MKKRLPFIILVLAVLISLALHFDIFSIDIIGYHVWRQTQTQTVIDNFCKQDFSIFNPRVNNLAYPDGIMRTEFPLYQWMIACVVKITGCQALPVARVFTFVTGVFSMLGFYLLANAIFRNKVAAALGAGAFFFSPVLYYYTVNPLPDNLALCFAIYALYFFVAWFNSGKRTHLFIYAVFLSLATLTKLPFVLFGTPFLILVLKKKLPLSQIFAFILILAPSWVWYASVIDTWIDKGVVLGVMNGGYDFLTYLDYIQHNFISSIPELLINYATLTLFIYGTFRIIRNGKTLRHGLPLYLFMSLLAMVLYVLFELNMIAKVHDYYLFPLLPFLFLIILYGFLKMKQAPKPFFRVLAFVCMLATPVTAYLRCHTRWNMEHPGFNANLLKHKNEIRTLLPPNAICLTGNDDSGFINLYYLDRKGYIFYADMISVAMLEDYRKKGVTHVVSDALMGDDVRAFLKTPVAVFGDITIYKLN